MSKDSTRDNPNKMFRSPSQKLPIFEDESFCLLRNEDWEIVQQELKWSELPHLGLLE